jgi:ribosomal protein L11 methyltransferase
MVTEFFMGKGSITTPRELFVYECWGPRAPQKEPCFNEYLGLWPEPPFYYLFADRQVLSQVGEWVLTQPGWFLRDTYRLDYDAWQQGGLEPCTVGSFHLVKEGGAALPGDAGTVIHLRPGLVFGSGLHPTTQACLQLIDDYRGDFRDAKVIDLGTGTGVLTIACARLGASLVVAVDCNPMAIRETRVNIRLNAVEPAAQPVMALGIKAFSGDADWLIMNLEYPVLRQLLREEEWSRYPAVLLSGFMSSQWDQVQRLIPHSFRLGRWLDWRGWCAVVLRNGTGQPREKAKIIPG